MQHAQKLKRLQIRANRDSGISIAISIGPEFHPEGAERADETKDIRHIDREAISLIRPGCGYITLSVNYISKNELFNH